MHRGRTLRRLAGGRLPSVMVLVLVSPGVGVSVVAAQEVVSAPAAPPATFAAPMPYFAGGVGWGVESGDLNGDSAVDLVVANNLGIAVLLGDGVGGFGSPTQLSAGSRATHVALGDVNGDDVLDVVVANTEPTAPSISVLIGIGDGRFLPPTNMSTRLGPWGIALGDFDADGDLDLAAPIWNWTDGFEDPTPPVLSVWRGAGDGSFELDMEYPLSRGPLKVAIGDVDGDRVLDLAVVGAPTSTSGVVAILRGIGDGTFSDRVEYGAGQEPTGLALADLNGDTVLDLAVTNSAPDTVSVLLGDGEGAFGPAQGFGTGLWPEDVAVGDLNGDGLADLATANSLNSNASVLLGHGDGTFQPATNLYAPGSGDVVTAADLNRDSRLDLVMAGFGDSRVRVLLNTTGVEVPAAPTIGTAIAGDREATVSWAAPTWDGGSPVTGYVVTPYIGYYPLPSVTFRSRATTQTLTGLPNGVTYRFRVRAINPAGTGGYSRASNAVLTPVNTVPGAPVIGSASSVDQGATVSWTTPVTDGGSPIIGYVVTPYIGYFPLTATTFNSPATTQTVAGLHNGLTYRFRVRAINAVGTGGYSKVTNPITAGG